MCLVFPLFSFKSERKVEIEARGRGSALTFYPGARDTFPGCQGFVVHCSPLVKKIPVFLPPLTKISLLSKGLNVPLFFLCFLSKVSEKWKLRPQGPQDQGV